MNIDLTAMLKTAEDFFALYKEGDEIPLYHGQNLLNYALANTKAKDRYAISNFLLDKGVDVQTKDSEGNTALMVLLNQYEQDVPETTKLCKRIIELGVDLSALNKKSESAMQDLVNFSAHERDLGPLYDLLFSQPGLDFTTKNKRGYSALDLAIKSNIRPLLVERMQAYGQ